MNRVKASGSVVFASRDIAPVSGTPQYYTSGNPATSTPATVLPGYWVNMVMDEISQVIIDAGITLDDTDWSQLSKALNNRSSIVGRTQIFTTSGTFTWPTLVTSAEIWGWGPGGAGGASSDGTGNIAGTAGCGGGSGAFFYARVSGQTPGTTTAVTIGAAGVGAANAAINGGNGTATSFGAFATANGGAGGQSGRNANIVGGVGGGASGGVLNINGGQGGTGGPASTFDPVMPLHVFNKGGMAPYAVGTLNWFGTGVAPNGFCSGGSGASGGSAVAGGNGGPGLMIVRW